MSADATWGGGGGGEGFLIRFLICFCASAFLTGSSKQCIWNLEQTVRLKGVGRRMGGEGGGAGRTHGGRAGGRAGGAIKPIVFGKGAQR